jgi:type II secretory pathway component PulM
MSRLEELERAEQKLRASGALISELLVEAWRARTGQGEAPAPARVEGALHDALNEQALALNAIRRAKRAPA